MSGYRDEHVTQVTAPVNGARPAPSALQEAAVYFSRLLAQATVRPLPEATRLPTADTERRLPGR